MQAPRQANASGGAPSVADELRSQAAVRVRSGIEARLGRSLDLHGGIVTVAAPAVTCSACVAARTDFRCSKCGHGCHAVTRGRRVMCSECECVRWAPRVRLVSSAGGFVPGRCRATNLCRYCQKLWTLETVEMLTLDAIEHAPQVWMVLTSREHLTRPDFNAHLRKLRLAVRAVWPSSEYFVQVEFQRRGALHGNLLWKGIGVHDRECAAWAAWDYRSGAPAPECGGCLRCVASAVWCRRVDAEPQSQWVGAVEDGVGVVRYLSKMLAHGLKAEQRPPVGWRGHRTSQTRGYLVRPASVMRVEAQRALRLKRALWRAEREGLAGGEALLQAEAELHAAEQVRWEAVVVTVNEATGEVSAARRLDGSEPTVLRTDRAGELARRLSLGSDDRAYQEDGDGQVGDVGAVLAWRERPIPAAAAVGPACRIPLSWDEWDRRKTGYVVNPDGTLSGLAKTGDLQVKATRAKKRVEVPDRAPARQTGSCGLAGASGDPPESG